MAKYHRTEGICLRRIDYSNTSQVASFLTRDSGLMSFMAKGVKRAPKKGIKRGLDLLCRYEIVYTHRRTESLANLTERTLQESFRDIRKALDRILYGYYAAELVLNFVAEGQPCPELYESLLTTLRLCDAGEKLELGALLLEIAALRDHGSLPPFAECAECRKPVAGAGRLVFSAREGGPLCAACQANPTIDARGMPVKFSHLAVLESLAHHTPPRPERVNVGQGQVRAMSRILRFHIQYLLGRNLVMWKHLRQR